MSIAMHPTLKEAAEYLEELALSATTKDIHRRHFPFGRLHGLWEGSYRTASPFIDYMKKVTKGKKMHKQLRLGITALTDPPNELPDTEEGAPGSIAYFTLDETYEPMWEAGYATSAFPGVFEPIKIQNRWCLDGGVQVVTPISDAIKAGATHIDVVVAETPLPSYRPTGDMPNTLSNLLRSLELAIHRLTWVDIRYTQRINQLVELGHPDVANKRLVHMTVVHPTSNLNSDPMEFNPKEAAQIALRGYNQGIENPPLW